MGFKSKIIFMMIVYFAGFATAIYYLAPSQANADGQETYYGSDCQKDNSSKETVMNKLFEKTYERTASAISGMDSQQVKEKFNLGMKKLMEMARSDPDKQEQ